MEFGARKTSVACRRRWDAVTGGQDYKMGTNISKGSHRLCDSTWSRARRRAQDLRRKQTVEKRRDPVRETFTTARQGSAVGPLEPEVVSLWRKPAGSALRLSAAGSGYLAARRYTAGKECY